MTTISDARAAAKAEPTLLGKAVALLNHIPDAINTAIARGDTDLAGLKTAIQSETASLAMMITSTQGHGDSPSIKLAQTGAQANTSLDGSMEPAANAYPVGPVVKTDTVDETEAEKEADPPMFETEAEKEARLAKEAPVA